MVQKPGAVLFSSRNELCMAVVYSNVNIGEFMRIFGVSAGRNNGKLRGSSSRSVLYGCGGTGRGKAEIVGYTT